MPRRADLALGIASFEQPAQLGVAAVVEPFVGLRQEPPCAVERIGLAAPMTEGLVLHPASALVQLVVGQLGEVERIGDLAGMPQAFVEDLAVGARHVEHPPTDGLLPGFGLLVEPLERLDRRAAFDDVDQLRGASGSADVDDRGAPLLDMPLAGPVEQRLIQAERVDSTDSFGVGLEERFAVGEDGVVDGAPVTAQFDGDLVHRAPEIADLLDDPAAGPIRQRHPWRRDASVDDRPRPRRAGRFGAVPAVLAPHQPGRAPEARQVDQLHPGPVLDPSAHPAGAAPRRSSPGFDVHDDRLVRAVINAQDVDIRQADKQLAHARSVGLHRGSGALAVVGDRRFLEPLCRARWTPLRHRCHQTPLRSEAPLIRRSERAICREGSAAPSCLACR